MIETTRLEKGISVQQLIKDSGITRRTYFRKMRGDTDFTTSDIDALAKALGCDAFLILEKASGDSEEEIMARVNARIDAGGFGLAADHDPDKEASKGVDSEFA